jgi:hypothetical protein
MKRIPAKKVKITIKIDDEDQINLEFDKMIDFNYVIDYDIKKVYDMNGPVDLHYTGRKNFILVATEFEPDGSK